MSNQRDFQIIIKHTDMQDQDELRDVLALMADELDKQDHELADLKDKIKRINEMFPSTIKR